jgi:aldose 1-epimerase
MQYAFHTRRKLLAALGMASMVVIVAVLLSMGALALAQAGKKPGGKPHQGTGSQQTTGAQHGTGSRHGNNGNNGGHKSRHGSRGLSITGTMWSPGTPPAGCTPPSGTVYLFTLRNGHRMTVNISNYGGVVQSIWVPDRAGQVRNVALGFPTLTDYYCDFTQGQNKTSWPLSGGSGDTYFGAIIGRYANRIADGSFTMTCSSCSNDGMTYTLDQNNGTNTLHGGFLGWNTQVWTPTTEVGSNFVALKLTANLPAGEGCTGVNPTSCTGFPAPITATVTYTLTQDNKLKIDYSATNTSTSNEATVINLTNHTYFNLAGEGSGSVLDQLLAINADQYTPIDTSFIPEAPFFVPVAGTAFDFSTMKPIGQDITNLNLPDGVGGTPYGPFGGTPSTPFNQLVIAHGYDHNWVLNGSGNRLVSVAQDLQNGITLWTYTDQPGVQVYTGNFLVGDLSGPSGHTYRQTSAFTLETQHYPDSPHHIGVQGWPSVVLNAGDTFTSTTTYGFTTEGRGLQHHFHF